MKRNFLLGKGERLTESITVRGGGGPKDAPYTFSEAKGRLAPRLATATIAIDALPREACPDDQAVISLTLNPEYIAKSYYPLELLRSVGVTPVGSRPTRIKPEKRSKGRAPKETITTEIFVAGSRTAFRQWSSELPQWREIHAGGRDLLAIEDISAPEPKEKIKGPLPPEGQSVFEVVLHADALLH